MMSRMEPNLLISKQGFEPHQFEQMSERVLVMYIVDIDIAKRFHETAIIDRNGNVVVKRIRFANSHAGFLKLMDTVRKLDASA